MLIELVATDWQRAGKSIHNTEEAFNLSIGDLHPGASFPVDVVGLPPCIENEIRRAAITTAYLVVIVRPLPDLTARTPRC
jgi:hypothetical protein